MTHAEALARPCPNGTWPGRDCPGELVNAGTFPDRAYGVDGETLHLIDIRHCARCHCTIASDHADGRVLNCYPVGRAGPLVTELARAFELPTSRTGREDGTT
jgi:hypothetical protein